MHVEQVEPHNRNPKHVAQWISSLETYVFPKIGQRPVHAVDQVDVLRILAPIWTEKPETARRVKQRRSILDWARTAGLRDGVSPVERVESGLPKQKDKPKHHPALPYADVPALMERLETLEGGGS